MRTEGSGYVAEVFENRADQRAPFCWMVLESASHKIEAVGRARSKRAARQRAALIMQRLSRRRRPGSAQPS